MNNANLFLEENGHLLTGNEDKKHIYEMLSQLRDRAEQRVNSYLELDPDKRTPYHKIYNQAVQDIQRIDALLLQTAVQ